MSPVTLDFSKAQPINQGGVTLDFSKAQPIAGQQAQQQPLGVPQGSISAQPAPFSLPWLKSKAYVAADKASQLFPAAGATIGGIIGAGGGSAAPGLGTVLGGAGGAAFGGEAGEAGRQLFRRMLGFESPQTSEEAAWGIAKEGLQQGAIGGAAEALPFLAPMLKRAALGQYTRALAPTTKANKAIAQDIAPEMIQRGVKGSLGSIEEQAASNASGLRPQLDAAYNAMPAQSTAGSGSKVISDLDALKGKYLVQGQVANPAAVKAISDVQDIVRQYGPDVSPNSLRQLKQIFDEPVAAKGGYSGADLATQYAVKSQKAAANSIRNILNQASPDVNALNKEISFWLDVKRVAGASALRRTGQEGGLMKVLTPLGAGAAGGLGFAMGGAHASVEAGSLAALSALAVQIVRSPAWRTASAVYKNQLAEGLASGSVGQVTALAARIGIAAPQMNRQDGQPNSLPTLLRGQFQSGQVMQ